MLGLVLATLWEAEPFLRELALTECRRNSFPVYGGDEIRLIISGIGKTDAALACAHLIERHRSACICNLGAAGATTSTFGLGEIYHVAGIIEPDRPDLQTGQPHAQTVDTLDGFPRIVLATQDRPVIDPAERARLAPLAGLVDMEGAAVAQACRRYQVPCYLFKFVSDTPDHTSTGDILRHIFRFRDAFCRCVCDEVLPAIRGGVLRT